MFNDGHIAKSLIMKMSCELELCYNAEFDISLDTDCVHKKNQAREFKKI